MDRDTFAGNLKSEHGFIYFIACCDFIKVGYSVRPRDRFRKIATMSQVDMQLIGIRPGGTRLEREIHARFAAVRFRHEWFHATPDLRSWIDQECGDWSAVAVINRPKKPKSAFDMLLDEARNDPEKLRQLFAPVLVRSPPNWDL